MKWYFWLLTWTTYGMWLPGDSRGSVSRVRAGPGPRVRHNRYGTPVDSGMPGLRRAARAQMKQPPTVLEFEHATVIQEQLLATAKHCGWQVVALAVMPNHVHVVLGVSERIPGNRILQKLKSYTSRALNCRYGKGNPRRWWTRRGSRRLLPDRRAVIAAVHYVQNQHHPLVVWTAEGWPEKLEVVSPH